MKPKEGTLYAPAGRERKLYLLSAVLLLATVAAYQPAWHGGMLWDDDAHITSSALRSADGLQRIWFDLGATQQYYPVVHSVFWLLFKLWGESTLGYHLLSIALHALSAILLAVILRRLAVPGAFLAAILFALHPVQVESVAWISELKNTLSGVLYLGAVLAYLHFDRNRRKRFYAAALALFTLAILSKTVVATLPAALLVLFWWQRGKLDFRRDVMPLVPFFALGIAAGLLTAWVERILIGARGAEFQVSVIERGLIAGRVIWFYLGKLVWPANLTFIYPRWQISQEVWWQYLYPAGALVLLAGLWRLRKRSRAPLAALLLFCGTLFPALGFINVFPFRFSFVADHFQYLASLSVIAIFSAGLAHLSRRWHLHRIACGAAVLVLGGILGALTWGQSRQYTDAATLYRATISRNPSCWMAYNNLGILELPGRPDEAIAHFKDALRLKPEYDEALNNLGHALEIQGRTEEAIARYREALRVSPDFFEAQYSLGLLLQKLGRPEALEPLTAAVRLKPDAADARNNLGNVLDKLGRHAEALEQFEMALRLKPDLVDAWNNLGNAMQAMGRMDEALAQYRQALALKPDNPEAHHNLGVALQRMGRPEDAAAQYREALRLKPDYAEAHLNLGFALQGLGRLEEAAVQYREALRLNPGYADAYFNLGNVLQLTGRVGEAVEQYQQAVKRKPGDAEIHNNLGVALERLGRLSEALAQYKEALRLNPDSADAGANASRISGNLSRKRLPRQ